MDAQELITAPASTLTRKQRRERAALKRQIAKAAKVPESYMLGRVGVAGSSLLPQVEVRANPRPMHIPAPREGDMVTVRIGDRPLGRFSR